MSILSVFIASAVIVIITTLCVVGLLLMVRTFQNGLAVRVQFSKNKRVEIIHKGK
jgi:hypothetical protein